MNIHLQDFQEAYLFRNRQKLPIAPDYNKDEVPLLDHLQWVVLRKWHGILSPIIQLNLSRKSGLLWFEKLEKLKFRSQKTQV